MSNVEPRTIDITPHWPGMFQFAIQLCRDGMSEGDGSGLVIEMLEYGERLAVAAPELIAALQDVAEQIAAYDSLHGENSCAIDNPVLQLARGTYTPTR
jgi:hypothetical protein